MKYSTFTILLTAGRGPHECTYVVAQVWKILRTYLEQHGCQLEITQKRSAKYDETYHSVLMTVAGSNIPKICAPWIGTIQWIGQSPYRKNHHRKNYFIGCYLIKNLAPSNIDLSEVVFKTFRASGPGGQHRNKVETAVRLTHKRLGFVIEATEHRSQHQNKALVIEKLKKAIKESELQQQKIQIEEQWKQAITLERGNPIKTFKGKKFTPVL